MSYQPYPSGGAYQPYPAGGNQPGQRPEQPNSVRNAVWLMYGGAALSGISAILVLALSSTIRTPEGNALQKRQPDPGSQGKKPLTAAQIHSVENVDHRRLRLRAGWWGSPLGLDGQGERSGPQLGPDHRQRAFRSEHRLPGAVGQPGGPVGVLRRRWAGCWGSAPSSLLWRNGSPT